MANCASTRATQLYDRRRDEMSLDGIGRSTAQGWRTSSPTTAEHFTARRLLLPDEILRLHLI
jgi:hypothetical protein